MDKPKQCKGCEYLKTDTGANYVPNTIYTCKHSEMPFHKKFCGDTDVLFSNCPIKEDNDR